METNREYNPIAIGHKYTHKLVYVTLSNGQEVPTRKGSLGYCIDWNAITTWDGYLMQPERKALVMRNAEAADETHWAGGNAGNYGHDELYVPTEQVER